jgi:hypothetical protein
MPAVAGKEVRLNPGGIFTAEHTEIAEFGVFLDEDLSFALSPPRLGGGFASGGISWN